MKYSIVYSSITGNTKMLAEQVKEVLPSEDLVYFGEPDDAALSADRIYVGFWTDKETADLKTLEFLKKVEKREIILFGTAGFGMDAAYFEKLLKKISEAIPAGNFVLPGFMCQGKMPVSVRKRYEGILAEKPGNEGVLQFIKNFDMALTHPDQQDLDRLKAFIEAGSRL